MTAKIDGTNGLIQQYDYQVPTTGFSYTFAAGTTVLVMQPAGTLATGTITMPAAPADGMTIKFSSTQTITALTVAGNTGQSITGQPTSLGAGHAAEFVYRLSNTTWYPITTHANGTITNATLVTPNIDSAQIPTISGTAPIYMCRAWVNFNGTTATPSTIRGSGNVSSVTKAGTGSYVVNFTTAMPDTNFQSVGTSRGNADSARGVGGLTYIPNATLTTGTVGLQTGYGAGATVAGAQVDFDYVYVTIFR